MPKKPRKQDDEDHPQSPALPTPYPIDEAIEQAHQVSLTESDRQNEDSGNGIGADWMDDEPASGAAEQPSASEPARPERSEPSTEPSEASKRSPEPVRASEPSTEQAGRPAGQEAPRTERRGGQALMPQTLADRLAPLPRWQRHFVVALMECGGSIGVACNSANVSMQSVSKYRLESAEFDLACAEAIDYANDLMEAAGFRGATVGNLSPIFQGGVLVGHKRVRSPKDLETMLKVRGRLKDEPKQLGPSHTMRVEIVSAAEVPQRVADTMKRLYAARGKQPVLDAETGRPVAQDPTRGV